jgi:hypothetical protein
MARPSIYMNTRLWPEKHKQRISITLGRHLSGVFGIWLCAAALYGQQSNTAQSEKHFGSVCAGLTGDPECKVCGLGNSSRWSCYSHSLWEEIPGTSLPVAEQPPPKKRTKSSNPDSCSAGACGSDSCPSWSSKFDEIQDDQVLSALRQQQNKGWNGTTANNLSALKSALNQVEDSISQVDEAINALGGGDYHSVDEVQCKKPKKGAGALEAALCEMLNRQNMILALKGTLEIANCHCEALTAYRDTQLEKDFDAAMSQYSIFGKGMLDQEKYAKDTLNLMNNEWWFGQTTAEIASQVKFFTDEFNDIAGMAAPESPVLKSVQYGAIAVDVIKAEIQDGAKAAYQEAKEAAAKELAEEENGPLASMTLDALEYKEREEGMAAFKAQVQERVRAIEKTVRSFNTKMKQSKARARAIEDMMAQIDHACDSGPTIDVTPR